MSWEDLDDWESAADADVVPAISSDLDAFSMDDNKSKAAWEDEDEEGVEDKKWDAPAPQPKKESDGKIKVGISKKKGKKKIAEPVKDERLVDPVEEKKRQERLKRKADFESTRDAFAIDDSMTGEAKFDDGMGEDNEELFGGVDANDDDAVDIGSMTMLTFKPKTQKDFETYAQLVSDEVLQHSAGKEKKLYAEFLKELLKRLVEPCSAEDTRTIVQTLNVIVNNKITTEKKAPKKKRATKSKTVGKEGLEDDLVDDEFDAF